MDQVQLRDEGSVYSEVTEEEYAQLVAQRRLQGDFVENDGEDSGYADDGEENWAEYQLAEEAGSRAGRGGAKQCPANNDVQLAAFHSVRQFARPAAISCSRC